MFILDALRRFFRRGEDEEEKQFYGIYGGHSPIITSNITSIPPSSRAKPALDPLKNHRPPSDSRRTLPSAPSLFDSKRNLKPPVLTIHGDGTLTRKPDRNSSETTLAASRLSKPPFHPLPSSIRADPSVKFSPSPNSSLASISSTNSSIRAVPLSTEKKSLEPRIRNRRVLPKYEIPKHLEEMIKNDIVPSVIMCPLSPSTYADYFATLLYAEDFYIEKWSKYLLHGVPLNDLTSNIKLFRANAAYRDYVHVPDDIIPSSLYEEDDERFACPPLADLLNFNIITCTFMSSFRLHAAGIDAEHFTHVFLVDASYAIDPEVVVPLANLAGKNTAIFVTGSSDKSPAWVRSDIARRYGLKRSYFNRLYKR